MGDDWFESWMAAALASSPAVVAVALGGSRAQKVRHIGSDWDFAVYNRGCFDPSTPRAKGWKSEVSDVDGSGGGVTDGGAWLSIDGRRVDVHYRNLDEVEHWCAEVRAGKFRKNCCAFTQMAAADE